MATLKQMTDRVLDSSDRSISASRSEVNALVNDAYFETVMSGRTTLTTGALTLVAGQGDYSLSTLSILSIKYLAFTESDLTTYAEPTSLDEIINLRGLTQPVSAQTPFLYSLAGNDFLSIYPTPSATTTCTIYYYYRPDPLGSDGASPPDYILPPEFHDLIVLRALAKSARTINKGKAVGYVSAASTSRDYQGQYEAGLIKLRQHMNRAIGSRSASVRVGQPRRPFSGRNDIYYSGDSL